MGKLNVNLCGIELSNPVIPALKSIQQVEQCASTGCEAAFLLCGDILNIADVIDMLHHQAFVSDDPALQKITAGLVDRLAQKVTGIDGIDAMFALMVGKHLYKDVDKQAYLHYAQTVNGFFVWCVNLVSSHPVMTKRIQALAMKQGSGKLY